MLRTGSPKARATTQWASSCSRTLASSISDEGRSQDVGRAVADPLVPRSGW